MKQNVIIRRYQKEDLEDVKNICIATASERARREEKHRQFTLYMYCLPYLERERALVAEVDGVVVGYDKAYAALYVQDRSYQSGIFFKNAT